MEKQFKVLTAALTHAMSTTVEKPRRLDKFLHYSSMPFCALKTLFNTLENRGFHVIENMQFGMRYYTAVGTVVHEVIQEYMATLGTDGKDFEKDSLGAMVGDFECKACDKKYPFSTNPICSCGERMEYSELSVKWGENLIGHTDGLFLWRPKGKKRYIVIDYKTTSSKAVWFHQNRAPSFPYTKNVAQIEAYIVSMEKQYDIEIDGWALIYMPRDNPMAEGQTVVCGEIMSEDRKHTLRKRLRKADRHWPIMLAVEKYNDKGLDLLIEQKPCQTRREHDKLWGASEFDRCPLYDVCFKEDALRSTLKKTLKKRFKYLPLADNLAEALDKK